MAVDIQKLRDKRINEDYMLDIRMHRTHLLGDWKTRIEKVDRLYRGEWDVIFPDETSREELPHIMNLVQTAMDDVAKLVSEATPSVKCFPADDSEPAAKNAYLREAIAETYWDRNRGDILAPKLAMDLVGTGACFVVVDTTDKSYPCLHRIDPRMAYPDTHNGILYDLLVAQTMKVRTAAKLFPRLELERFDNPDFCDGAEVLEYYSRTECVQAVLLTKSSKPIPNGYLEVRHWDPEGVLPVAFAQADSFDGEFRGMFDQVTGSLGTKNRIVKLMLDYTDQLVYSPLVSKGLLNPETQFGPNAHFRLDPNVQDAQMGRIGPGGPAPQLERILHFLDQEQRAGVNYPAQRQGEIKQSIASASFVAATQGPLTSTIRNIQRLLGFVREQLNAICFELDEKFMNEPKPLVRSVGAKKEYTPASSIKGMYDSQVTYGAGAGLDRMNADVRVLQHLGAGLISRETARKQIEYLSPDGEEHDRINREMAEQAFAQKFLTEAPWDMVAAVFTAMADGKSLMDAVKEVMGEQAQSGPAAAPAPTGTPGPVPAEQSAAQEQLALQKGQTAGPGTEPEFMGQPITSILVRQGGN